MRKASRGLGKPTIDGQLVLGKHTQKGTESWGAPRNPTLMSRAAI